MNKIHPLYSVLLSSVFVPQVIAGERPNILYIMSDDHSAQAISCYGGILKDVLPTPNIDRIGNEGIRFENAFCTNSISTPSRAVILTGKYSNKNGVYTLDDRLDINQNNVAKILQTNGYQTAVVGKWHLASEPQGFDYYSVYPGQGSYVNPVFLEKGEKVGTDFEYSIKKKVEGYSSDITADKTISWMENRDKSKPFMMMCHFKAPHRNWICADRHRDLLKDVTIPEPANLIDMYKGKGEYVKRLKTSLEDMKESDLRVPKPAGMTRDQERKWAYQVYMKNYLRCIAGVDENVGRLLEYLDKHGLAENTIVIYTSDQGFFLGEHGWFDKRMMYEESLRMPLLIRYPKEIKKGAVNKKDMIVNIDYAPTLLDFAGIPKDKDMQGVSFRPILIGKTPADWRQGMYYRYWMHDDNTHHVPGQYGIRTDRYKLIFFYNQPLGKNGAGKNSYPAEWELYDIKNDPMEMINLYPNKKYQKIITELKSQLKDLKKQYGDEDDLMN